LDKKKLSLILILSLAPVAAHASDFAGRYAGIQLGQVNGKDDGIELQPTPTFDGYTQNTSPKGTAFGILGGYNWAINDKLLWGVDGGLELRSMSDNTVQYLNGVPDPAYPTTTKVNQALSVRAKLGYLFNEGRTMAYLAAGLADAHITRNFGGADFSEWKTGYTVGLGAEHYIKEKVSLSLDYRYTDYGTSDVDVTSVFGPANTIEQQKYKEQSLLLGVAYHF
jgi:outer membrane immunogenic protein